MWKKLLALARAGMPSRELAAKYLYWLQDRLVEHKLPWTPIAPYEEATGDIYRELGKSAGAPWGAGYITEKARRLNSLRPFNDADVAEALYAKQKAGFEEAIKAYKEGFMQLKAATTKHAPEDLAPEMQDALTTMFNMFDWTRTPRRDLGVTPLAIDNLINTLKAKGRIYPEGIK